MNAPVLQFNCVHGGTVNEKILIFIDMMYEVPVKGVGASVLCRFFNTDSSIAPENIKIGRESINIL